MIIIYEYGVAYLLDPALLYDPFPDLTAKK